LQLSHKLLSLEPYCSTPEVHQTSSIAGSGKNILYLLMGPMIRKHRTNRQTYHSTAAHVQLESLAVYGRASMAAFRQLSTHGQKFDPESLYEPM